MSCRSISIVSAVAYRYLRSDGVELVSDPKMLAQCRHAQKSSEAPVAAAHDRVALSLPACKSCGPRSPGVEKDRRQGC